MKIDLVKSPREAQMQTFQYPSYTGRLNISSQESLTLVSYKVTPHIPIWENKSQYKAVPKFCLGFNILSKICSTDDSGDEARKQLQLFKLPNET